MEVMRSGDRSQRRGEFELYDGGRKCGTRIPGRETNSAKTLEGGRPWSGKITSRLLEQLRHRVCG